MQAGKLIQSVLDFDAAKTWTEQLHIYERNCSHSGFAAAAEYCCRALAEAGFENISMIEHRADGRSTAFDCTMPPAWELCGRSVLRVVEDDIVLADSDVIPFAAAPWSAPTAPEGVCGELIAVTPGENADVNGKWVLLVIRDGKNPAGEYLEQLRRAGAVGVAAVDFSSGTDYPQAVRWFNGTGRFGWYPVAEDQRLPMFAISAESAQMLLQKLAAGKVTLHGVMNSRISAEKIYTVTALLPGKDAREYALFSHMYEPFAADNAFGFGAICAIGKAIRESIGTPEKSLRVVFSMELYGFAAYLADRERASRIVGALNMDAINHRKQQVLKFFDSPLAAPWFGDWVLPEILQQCVAESEFFRVAGTLSDDTFAGDPLLGGIPVNWCMNPSGTAHHCGCDDFEADWAWAQDELPAFAAAIAEMLQFSPEQAEELPAIATAEFARKSVAICESTVPAPEKLLLLNALYQYLNGRLESAERYCGITLNKNTLAQAYRECAKNISGMAQLSDIEILAADMVPERLKPTPFSLADIPVAERQSFRVSRLLFSLFDGKRNLLDALRLADWSGGTRSDDRAIAAEIDRLKYLEKYGYIALRQQQY